MDGEVNILFHTYNWCVCLHMFLHSKNSKERGNCASVLLGLFPEKNITNASLQKILLNFFYTFG